jgi:hypothetical protein
VTALAF